MELNIEENELNINNEFNLKNYGIEDIPENNIKLPKPKLIRQTNNLTSIKSIPKQYAKQVRPYSQPQRPNISYDDILNKMGMFVKEGQLHLLEDKKILNSQQNKKIQQSQKVQQPEVQIPQNSYIYNKYFKNELTQKINMPRNINEYKLILVNDIIQKEKAKRFKSTKLIMPNSNINIAARPTGDLNKLFNFPHK